MKRIYSKYGKDMPDEDHYAVLHFRSTTGNIVTEYIVFDDRSDFAAWIEKNRDESYFPLIARKLDVEVKVDVVIKTFDKNIPLELTETP